MVHPKTLYRLRQAPYLRQTRLGGIAPGVRDHAMLAFFQQICIRICRTPGERNGGPCGEGTPAGFTAGLNEKRES